MAGQYSPKRGKYAGEVFTSYRQYLNRKAQDAGFSNFYQQTEQRKLVRESKFDYIGDRKRGPSVWDIFDAGSIPGSYQFTQTLRNNAIIQLIVRIEIVEEDKQRNKKLVKVWRVLLPATRANAIKDMSEQEYLDMILEILQGNPDYPQTIAGILDTHVWVLR